MVESNSAKITIGSCSKCGRKLRVKPRGLRQNVRLTCKCGHINTLDINQGTLSQYGVIRTPIDIFQTRVEQRDVPLYLLLDGPRLRTMWAEAEAKQARRNEEFLKDKNIPRESWPSPSELPDLISVSINPYASDRTARGDMKVLVNRVKGTDKARPWSIELFENFECDIIGLIDAPFFIILGITGDDAYDTLKQIVHDLRSDYPQIGAGAEWEFWSQNQGNQWRRDRCARLLERWVFLDTDVVYTFGVQDKKAEQSNSQATACQTAASVSSVAPDFVGDKNPCGLLGDTVCVSVYHKNLREGEFARVTLSLQLGQSGSGYIFVDRVGQSIPSKYIRAVEEGARKCLSEQELSDAEVTLEKAVAHPVDSSSKAFATAAHKAITEALRQLKEREKGS